MENLQHWMLRTMRGYIIRHKDIFKTAIIAYAKALPDPDKMECDYVNTPILKRERDKFMGFLNLKGQEHDLYEAFWKIVICEMVHDPDHRALLEFMLEEIVESIMDGEWKPREVGMPGPRVWGEPRTAEGNYGGYRGRRFRKLIGQNK